MEEAASVKRCGECVERNGFRWNGVILFMYASTLAQYINVSAKGHQPKKLLS